MKNTDFPLHVLSKLEYSELLKSYWLFAGFLRCPKQFISAPEIKYTGTFVASEEISVTFIQSRHKKNRSTYINPLVFRIAVKKVNAFCHD
jgi:hypothetical protein